MKAWFWTFFYWAISCPTLGLFQKSQWPLNLHAWSLGKMNGSLEKSHHHHEHSCKQLAGDPAVLGLSGSWATTASKTKDANASVLVIVMGLPGAIDNLAQENGISVDSDEDRQRVLLARTRCLDRLADMIGEHFSDEDIQGLVEFYSSPLGIRFATNQAETFKHFGDIAERFINEATGVV